MIFADQALKQVVSKPRPVSHRLEIPLNPVDSDREHVDEAELLRILRQHRSEHAWGYVAKRRLKLFANVEEGESRKPRRAGAKANSSVSS